MIEEVLPLVEANHRSSGERLLLGASLGGLVSATLALLEPDLFSAVIAQSGAFLGTPELPEPYPQRGPRGCWSAWRPPRGST